MNHSSYQWSCPSCTYNNRPAAYKCHVCGTPKGTATRQQTKHYSSTVQQQHMMSLQLQAARAAASMARSQPSTRSNSVEPGSSSSSSGASGGGPSGKTTKSGGRSRKSKASARKEDIWPRLTNIDRSSKKSCKITVDNLSVIITEYDTLHPDS